MVGYYFMLCGERNADADTGVLAVTRALGDSYMKELVTGHPYTTESVVQHDLDEFIILACDGVGLSQPHFLFIPEGY